MNVCMYRLGKLPKPSGSMGIGVCRIDVCLGLTKKLKIEISTPQAKIFKILEVCSMKE